MRATAAAAAGGVLGATARWIVAAPFDTERGAFPWIVLAVNVLGCLAIGVAAMHLVADGIGWAFVVTGVLGGFTTMSGFALGTADLLDDGRGSAAAAYVVLTLAAGHGALLLGRRGTP